MKWEPIETAPKDGSWMLLAGGRTNEWHGCDVAERVRPVVGQWTTSSIAGPREGCWQFAWYDGGYYGLYENPTRWAPLPSMDESPRYTITPKGREMLEGK